MLPAVLVQGSTRGGGHIHRARKPGHRDVDDCVEVRPERREDARVDASRLTSHEDIALLWERKAVDVNGSLGRLYGDDGPRPGGNAAHKLGERYEAPIKLRVAIPRRSLHRHGAKQQARLRLRARHHPAVHVH